MPREKWKPFLRSQVLNRINDDLFFQLKQVLEIYIQSTSGLMGDYLLLQNS